MSTKSHFGGVERRAWLIIWSSFLVFCLLCISIPVGSYWYVTRAMEAVGATLQLADRPIYLNGHLINPPDFPDRKVHVRVGDTISTYTGGQATLWLDFDAGSSVQIWPNSEVRIAELNTKKFSWGDNGRSITLEQRSGFSHVDVSATTDSKRQFKIVTSEAVIDFQEGSHSVRILPPVTAGQENAVASLNPTALLTQPQKTEVAVRKGSATVTNQKSSITLGENQKIEVAADEPFAQPEPARWELISNGDFSQGFSGWQLNSPAGSGRGRGIEVTRRDDRQVILISRQGDDHSEDAIRQVINRDVTEFSSLKLRATFKVLEHSLSGGGVLGSEYPLMLRVTYRDRAGNINTWQHGFWSQNEDNLLTTLNGYPISEYVEQGSWKNYEIDLLDPSITGTSRPIQIISVEINCQGHTYVSAVSNVSLIGE